MGKCVLCGFVTVWSFQDIYFQSDLAQHAHHRHSEIQTPTALQKGEGRGGGGGEGASAKRKGSRNANQVVAISFSEPRTKSGKAGRGKQRGKWDYSLTAPQRLNAERRAWLLASLARKIASNGRSVVGKRKSRKL